MTEAIDDKIINDLSTEPDISEIKPKKRYKKSDNKDENESSKRLEFVRGQKVTIKRTWLYKNSAIDKSIQSIKGDFYIWSSEIISNRIRITDSSGNTGYSTEILGWIDISSVCH